MSSSATYVCAAQTTSDSVLKVARYIFKYTVCPLRLHSFGRHVLHKYSARVLIDSAGSPCLPPLPDS
jgi:hypothetical protein